MFNITNVLSQETRQKASNDKVQQFLAGLQYIDKKNYSKASTLLERSAKQGFVPAQIYLANWHHTDTNGLLPNLQETRQKTSNDKVQQFLAGLQHIDKKNYSKASALLEKSAKQGFVPAQIYLANWHNTGSDGALPNLQGIRQNNSNDKVQQFLAGLQYIDKKNYSKASTLLEKSAKQGFVPAQIYLANWYNVGTDGVLPNLAKAIFWYEQAANNRDKKSALILANLYYKQGDHNKAFIWYQKSAKLGQTKAQYHLAYLYANGIGVQASATKSFTWLNSAAKIGDAHAQYMLSNFYKQGLGVAKDKKKSLLWLKKSANLGLAKAQYKLASHYYFSKNNQPEAIAWLKRAYRLNLPEAIIVMERLQFN